MSITTFLRHLLCQASSRLLTAFAHLITGCSEDESHHAPMRCMCTVDTSCASSDLHRHDTRKHDKLQATASHAYGALSSSSHDVFQSRLAQQAPRLTNHLVP